MDDCTLRKTLERLDRCVENFDRHVISVNALVNKRLDEFESRIANRPTDWRRMVHFEVQYQLKQAMKSKPKWYQFWRRRRDN